MAEVVSFVANTTPAPPSGARTALKALAWALGVPTALAVLCVAFWDAGFLSGMMPSPLGQGAGIVGGILAAFGLATLLVAGGITYRELPIVSVMAFVLFAVCFWISLSAACGFAFVSTQPLRAIAQAVQQFAAEPRQRTAIERAIQRFRIEPREYWGGDRWYHATGDQILSNTGRCQNRRFVWESTQCEEWDYLQRERTERQRIDGAGSSAASGFDPAEFMSPGMINFNRYYSSGLAHLVIVLFAMAGGAIVSGCAYVLTMPPVGMAPVAPPQIGPLKTPTEQAFENFASEYILKDASIDSPSALLYLCYQLKCAKEGWPQYDGPDAFGRKLKPWVLAKHNSVETEKTKGRMVYTGVNLKSDSISDQARRTLENGAAA